MDEETRRALQYEHEAYIAELVAESSTDCHSFESAWEVDEETRRALQYEHEANLAELVAEMSLLENL